MARVIGVVGGSGGVGASVFAGVLASVARTGLLLDIDVTGGGIDVVLGIEAVPGARWSGLRLAGGELDGQVLLDGLPRWSGCAVLATDVDELDAEAVSQVLDAVDTAVDTVVLDLPRGRCSERAAALQRCDLVVVLARGDAPGIVAAHGIVHALPGLPVGVLVRGGGLAPRRVAQLIGAPLLGGLPQLPGGGLDLERRAVPRQLRAVARVVLDGLVLESVPR